MPGAPASLASTAASTVASSARSSATSSTPVRSTRAGLPEPAREPADDGLFDDAPASTPGAPIGGGAPPRHEDRDPVVADERWLRSTAEAHAAGMVARNDAEVQQHVQREMSRYASVDGEVWRADAPPVYRAPQPDEVTGESSVALHVAPALDTTRHAAIGYFPARRLDEALEAVRETAQQVGLPAAPAPEEPPIKWLAELGLVDESAWRAGAKLVIHPSSSLNEENFVERFEAFRQQIVDELPDAVDGDVGAFMVVGRHRLDTSALTKSQWDEYRRYVLFGLEHGLV